MNSRVPLLLLTLLATATAAQDVVNDENVELRRYSVEMIIFSYAQDVGTGSEVFTPKRSNEDLLQDVVLEGNVFSDDLSNSEGISEPAAPTSQPRKLPSEIVVLPSDQFTMHKIYDEMRRLGVYEPLMHFGWTQVTLPEDESDARPLSSFATPPSGLDGELTLYLSRYLHLNVDLKLDAAGQSRQTNSFEYSEPVRYHIAENRILRNGELRYFDHPKFGVLAKIMRVEEEKDPLDEPELFGFDGQ